MECGGYGTLFAVSITKHNVRSKIPKPWLILYDINGNGNLELIFHEPNVKDIVKIKGDEIKVKYFDAKYDTTCYCNAGLRKMDDFPDPYAWRTVGYDPQHTGYYPLPIYPPMELKWTYNWGVLVAGQPR